MKPSVKRTFSLLLSLALLLVSFAGYAILVRPAYKDVLGLRGVLRSKNQFLREQNLALGRVNDLILQYRGTGKLQDTISFSFPLEEDLASIFNQLRALAGLNGLSIEIFGVKPQAFKSLVKGTLVKDVGTLQLSLKLTGPYAAFKNFLKGLETNIRIMDIQQTTIERLGSPATDFFAYNLVISAYYQGK